MANINVAEIMGALPTTSENCERIVGASREMHIDHIDHRDPRTFIKKQRADIHSAEIRLNTMLQCLEDIYNVVNSTDHTGTTELWADYYKDVCAVMNNCIEEEKAIILGA